MNLTVESHFSDRSVSVEILNYGNAIFGGGPKGAHGAQLAIDLHGRIANTWIPRQRGPISKEAYTQAVKDCLNTVKEHFGMTPSANDLLMGPIARTILNFLVARGFVNEAKSAE
jgi:hypothetical protein